MVQSDAPSYVQINRKIWNTSQFRSLSDDARTLFFYLTTCPHGNMLGIFVLRPGYALDDLQWGIDRQRFAKSLAELLAQHLFKYDQENEIILDMEQMAKHPPINPNQTTAAIKIINSLPKTPLFHDLKLLTESLGKSFLEPLAKRLGERFAHPGKEKETEKETGAGRECEGNHDAPPAHDGPPVDNFPVDEEAPPLPPLADDQKAAVEPKSEKPKPKIAGVERWTPQTSTKRDELLEDIRARYGMNYHGRVMAWVRSNLTHCNPNAMVRCLERLIGDRLAGKSILIPEAWLESALNGTNEGRAGENQKAEAEEFDREQAGLKGPPTPRGMASMKQILAGVAGGAP